MDPALVIGGIIGLILICQRWFWCLVFGVGGIAAIFACVASVVHFQILAAVGYLFLFWLLWGLAGAAAEG